MVFFRIIFESLTQVVTLVEMIFLNQTFVSPSSFLYNSIYNFLPFVRNNIFLLQGKINIIRKIYFTRIVKHKHITR